MRILAPQAKMLGSRKRVADSLAKVPHVGGTLTCWELQCLNVSVSFEPQATSEFSLPACRWLDCVEIEGITGGGSVPAYNSK